MIANFLDFDFENSPLYYSPDGIENRASVNIVQYRGSPARSIVVSAREWMERDQIPNEAVSFLRVWLLATEYVDGNHPINRCTNCVAEIISRSARAYWSSYRYDDLN